MRSRLELAVLTARIVSAYVTRNRVLEGELIPLLNSVFLALQSLSDDPQPPPQDEGQPVVPVKKSINSAYLVCLACGRRLKTLKRHLKSKHGLGVEEYRRKYTLGADYPVVAPNYAGVRSTLARKQGLGRSGAEAKTKRRK